MAAEPEGASAGPHRIGPYRLLSSLGEGGMGTVYLAEQTEPVQRRVALKVIKPGMDSKAVLARFDAERRALAMMDHPNIAKVLDAGCDPAGRPFFVMELVRGEPITTYCDRHRCSLEARLRLFLQVCQGIQHAHYKGILHRDVAPSNVLVETPGSTPVARIIDFGLARATNHVALQQTNFTEYGQLMGRPEYMSPEQAEMTGADIDTRTDVYSLGVVLYELVSGLLPFPKETLRSVGLDEIRRRIREVDPPTPSRRLAVLDATTQRSLAANLGQSAASLVRALREDIDWIVMRCLEKDRTRRYATVSELGADIERHLAGQPVLARPPSTGYRLKKFARNHRLGITITALVAGLTLGALVVVEHQRQVARDAVVELQRALTDLGQDFDLQLSNSLVQRARTLLPITFETTPDAQKWVDDTDALLRSIATGHRPVMHEKRDAEMQRVKEELTKVVTQLHGDPAWRTKIGDSLATVRRTEADLAARAADVWRRTNDELAVDRRFAGFTLAPQRGLVPLGADPETLLQEFAVALTGSIPTRDDAGVLTIRGDTAIVLVLLPGGTCRIGPSEGDALAFPNEGPATEITLEPFFLGKHELTVSQWMAIAPARDDGTPPIRPPNKYWRGTAPDQFVGPRSPVEMVSWNEVVPMLQRLGLVLPTEAQWEYAARAGNPTAWWTGAERESLARPVAAENIADAASNRARMGLTGAAEWPQYDDGFPVHAPVGSLRPNPLGLYDMLGNVKELCADTWIQERTAAMFRSGDGLLDLPPEPTKANRGGSFFNGVRDARVSSRRSIDARLAFDNVGVRPARRLDARR